MAVRAPKTSRFPMVVLGLALAAGCAAEDGRFFFLSSEDADMPVWIRGPDDARNTFVVLNGGPGAPAQTYIGRGALGQLEATHRVVYWEQRGGGSAQGNATAETMNVHAIARDLDDLITLVRHDYPDT